MNCSGCNGLDRPQFHINDLWICSRCLDEAPTSLLSCVLCNASGLTRDHIVQYEGIDICVSCMHEQIGKEDVSFSAPF